ncbi:hypothetical protein P691DRAFT_812572 [Macrolepiota fuliginosa MF-IS2]|uniref:Uncharacterized protein n=1 Tax=Macrolepiota fuliginosa MF-IS2 TaxID=1400762 RepID=A0A9P5XDK2_9AGAR|nr:hypothetical protein P691DRAFT_812572 [Macrolepiota fuliginosa MF-IS2]
MTFESLKSFSWATNGDPREWERALLQYAHLPALEHIKWHDRPIDPLVIDVYTPFFTRLPSTLRVLELDNFRVCDHVSPIGIFPTTLAFQELGLLSCQREFIHELMGQLAEDKMFPHMRKLVLDLNLAGFAGHTVNPTVEAVANMLEKRMDGWIGNFCFEVLTVPNDEWSRPWGAAAEILRRLEPRLMLMEDGEQFSLLD